MLDILWDYYKPQVCMNPATNLSHLVQLLLNLTQSFSGPAGENSSGQCGGITAMLVRLPTDFQPIFIYFMVLSGWVL